MRVAIIGGGAAGFFAAISVKQHHPNTEAILFEKSSKVLSKVRISGGGRCNVTNGCQKVSELLKAYPRGAKFLKKGFHQFNTRHTWEWFEQRGVKLKTEADGRVFPVSDLSETIIKCLWESAEDFGVKVQHRSLVHKIRPEKVGFSLLVGKAHDERLFFDKVIIASGGSPKLEGLQWLADLGHRIVPPIPSLFTFNMPKQPITQLMGLSVETVTASIQGEKLQTEGPLLITHWGMSGPAILKLSAFAARLLHQKGYDFTVQVNWLAEKNQQKVLDALTETCSSHPQKQIGNAKLFPLPERLWLFLLEKSGLEATKKSGEIGKKALNRLVNILTNDAYPVKGKTTFKEEFVTCGGVDLTEVSPKTMESKLLPGLYFAGEVLDIDAITGGYNFQAAWTTGYIAGQLA